jgi:hypothetical protein
MSLNAHSCRDSVVVSDKDKPVQLKEVVVKAQRIFRKADKFVMLVPRNASQNSEELIRQLPSVFLTDKDILINGSGGTKLYVDGREVKLTGEALITYLRSIPSSSIKKFEVQTSSDASQSADTKAGIIQVYLRKRLDDGIQLSSSVESRVGKNLIDCRPSLYLMGQSGRWNYYGSSSYICRPIDKGHSSYDRVYSQSDNSFVGNNSLSMPYQYFTMKYGALYSIDSLRTIGAEIEYATSNQKCRTDNSTILRLDADDMLSIGKYSQPEKCQLYSATVNYQQKLDERGSVFKVLADFVSKHSKSNSDFDIFRQWNSTDTIYRSHLSSVYNIASADISWHKCFANSNSLKLGAKYTFTDMNDKSDYESLYDNRWKYLNSFAYRLRYNEHIGAAYAIYSTKWRNWSVDAGLRMEYTGMKDRTNDISHSYTDFYPNLTINYTFDELKKYILSLRYSRNIERPDFNSLNPIRIQSSEYLYVIGNPLLRPTYINKIGATFVFDYRYILSVGCNMHRDLIREFTKQDADNSQVSYVTYENHYRENHWYVYLNIPLQPFYWLNFTTDATAVRQCIKTTVSDNFSNHNLLFLKFLARFSLSSSISFDAECNYHNRLYSGNSGTKSNTRLNLAIRKKWNDGKLTASVAVDNILDVSDRYWSQLDSYTTNSAMNLASNGRIIKFAVAWNFNSGKKLKRHQLENSSSDERNRFNSNK